MQHFLLRYYPQLQSTYLNIRYGLYALGILGLLSFVLWCLYMLGVLDVNSFIGNSVLLCFSLPLYFTFGSHVINLLAMSVFFMLSLNTLSYFREKLGVYLLRQEGAYKDFLRLQKSLTTFSSKDLYTDPTQPKKQVVPMKEVSILSIHMQADWLHKYQYLFKKFNHCMTFEIPMKRGYLLYVFENPSQALSYVTQIQKVFVEENLQALEHVICLDAVMIPVQVKDEDFSSVVYDSECLCGVKAGISPLICTAPFIQALEAEECAKSNRFLKQMEASLHKRLKVRSLGLYALRGSKSTKEVFATRVLKPSELSH